MLAFNESAARFCVRDLSRIFFVKQAHSPSIHFCDDFQLSIKVYTEQYIDPETLINQPATLTLDDGQSISGVLGQAILAYASSQHFEYEITLHSALLALKKTLTSRIFLDKSIQTIIRTLIKNTTISINALSKKMSKTIHSFTQWEETNFHTLCRICDENELLFFIKNDELTLFDRPHQLSRHHKVLDTTSMPGDAYSQPIITALKQTEKFIYTTLNQACLFPGNQVNINQQIYIVIATHLFINQTNRLHTELSLMPEKKAYTKPHFALEKKRSFTLGKIRAQQSETAIDQQGNYQTTFNIEKSFEQSKPIPLQPLFSGNHTGFHFPLKSDTSVCLINQHSNPNKMAIWGILNPRFHLINTTKDTSLIYKLSSYQGHALTIDNQHPSIALNTGSKAQSIMLNQANLQQLKINNTAGDLLQRTEKNHQMTTHQKLTEFAKSVRDTTAKQNYRLTAKQRIALQSKQTLSILSQQTTRLSGSAEVYYESQGDLSIASLDTQTFETPQGKISYEASNAIHFNAGHAIHLAAPRISLCCGAASCRIQEGTIELTGTHTTVITTQA